MSVLWNICYKKLRESKKSPELPDIPYCLLELEDRTLLLKTSPSLVTGLGEIKLIKTWSVLPDVKPNSVQRCQVNPMGVGWGRLSAVFQSCISSKWQWHTKNDMPNGIFTTAFWIKLRHNRRKVLSSTVNLTIYPAGKSTTIFLNWYSSQLPSKYLFLYHRLVQLTDLSKEAAFCSRQRII